MKKRRFGLKTVRAAAYILAAMLMISAADISVFADRESDAAQESSKESGEEDGKEESREDSQKNGDGENNVESGTGESGGENSGADEENNGNGESEATDSEKEETADASSETEMIEGDMGAVEVVLTAGIQVKADQTFQVLLKGRNDTERNELTLEFQNDETPATDRLRFSSLAEGTYQLIVAGNGYITYIQDIEVKKQGCRVSLYTGKTVGFSKEAQPGLLVYGDVNEDGQLNEADAAEIVAAMEAEQEGGSCDLNKDGRVDLLDLNYFTEFSENYQWQQATVETFIPSESVVSRTLNDTQVQEGSLDSAVDGEGQAVLGTVSGNEISEENPIGLEFDFSRTLRTATVEEIRMASPGTGSQSIDAGAVDITYIKNGRARTRRFPIIRTAGGELRAELEDRLEVRRAVVWITQAAGGTGSQAALSGIDFISDKRVRLPEPEPAVPKGISITPDGHSFTVSWEKVDNVTGYEAEVSFGEVVETYKTGGNRLEVSQFDGEALKENEEYEVRVQAVNGAWKSGYSQPVAIAMKPGRVPEAPRHVSLKAGAGSLTVAWEPCENADSYDVFYKTAAEETYEKATGIRGTEHKLKGLAEGERYQVYMTASGSLGESQPSLTAAARTMSADNGVSLPEYNLINLSEGAGEPSRHIRSVGIGEGSVMVDSPLDQEERSGLGLFDNSQTSRLQYDGRDFGMAVSSGQETGITAELDQVYEIGMIAFIPAGDTAPYTDARIWYWDGQNQRHEAEQVTLTKQGENGAGYYQIKMKAIRTSKLQIGIGRGGDGPDTISISEIRLYTYDSIEQDIMDLFADALHTELKSGVSGEDIQELRQRLDTEDTVSGGHHPERQTLLSILDEAQAVLDGERPENIVEIDASISAENDNELQTGGLTGWQPLGVTASAGEKLTVYVSHPEMEQGSEAELRLYFTQYHGEQEAYYQEQPLRIGRNTIIVPQISDTDKEKGGPLYIQYTGDNEKDRYQIRVDGGDRYPVLNLRRVSEEERKNRIQAYVQELDSYVTGLEEHHSRAHGETATEAVRYDYRRAECILNTTDIVTDHIMFSIPASQMLLGLGNSGQEKKLSDSAASMDEMLELFYQHIGLASSFAAGAGPDTAAKNHLPDQYLNIRYMEIPAGKLLYAADSHIGIGWNETGGLPDGRELAHAVGHQIAKDPERCAADASSQTGQAAWEEAEAAANYFAALIQSGEQTGNAGFSYDKVFDRVTSGTVRGSEDTLTRSAMYWQLHLAYDRDEPYKHYRNYQEICKNLFFARVNSYARNPASAPTGIELNLSGDPDQVFMRLASSAAERNLTEFFTRWGFTPDEETSTYMGQYAPEDRAIYYLDDSVIAYTAEHETESGGMIGQEDVTAAAVKDDGKVILTASLTPERAKLLNAGDSFLQGYEIARIVTEQGQERKEIIGFTRDGAFVDTLSGITRRTVSYEVTAVDKWMNRLAVCRTDAVEAEGEGRLDGSFWTVETNMISESDYKIAASRENPCGGGSTVSAAGRIADGRSDTTFTGWSDNEDPYLLINLGRKIPVSALRYTLSDDGSDIPMTPVSDYRIEVSTDGEQYVLAAEGTLELTDGEAMMYFAADQEVSYIKLTAVGQKGERLSCTELEPYGNSGDCVTFQTDPDNHLSAGILNEAYVFGPNPGDQVPAGALILIGEWQGRNPDSSVVTLYNENGEILGGVNEDGSPKAGQKILAPEPAGNEEKAAGDGTSKGIWLYWLESGKGRAADALPEKVCAELHQTIMDHAGKDGGDKDNHNGNNSGDTDDSSNDDSNDSSNRQKRRVVSDTPLMNLPEELPTVQLER